MISGTAARNGRRFPFRMSGFFDTPSSILQVSDKMFSGHENPYAPPTAAPMLPAEEPVENFELATLGERFLAALLDMFITGGFLAAVAYLNMSLDFLGSANWSVHLLEIGFFLLLNLWPLKRSGQTLGKMALRTKVVLLDGRKPSLLRLIGLRYLPLWSLNWMPNAGGWVELIDVLVIFGRTRRCLHDFTAGTKVVKIGRKAIDMPQPRLMPRRNPAHAGQILRGIIMDELDLDVSDMTPDMRWKEDLGISPEIWSVFLERLEQRFSTLTAEELKKCGTYGDLLLLLGIPWNKRPV